MEFVLANELLVNILRRVTYDDLLVIRKLNKKFEEIVNYVIGSEVVWLRPPNVDCTCFKLYEEEKIINLDNCLIGRSSICFKLNPKINPYFKKLIISGSFSFSLLSTLDNLVHLELFNFELKEGSNNILSCRSLVRLNLLSSSSRKLILDCFNLKYLSLSIDLSHLEVIYPNSIEVLECSSLSGIPLFENLRRIKVHQFDSTDSNYFNNFKCLEKIEILEIGDENNNEFIRTKYFPHLNSLAERNIIIFYKGILYQDDRLNEETESLGVNILGSEELDSYFVYQDYLSESLQQDILTTDNLDALPDLIIEKLTNLKKLRISKVTDEEKWIKFLKTSCLLQEIEILETIDQSLLELIPSYCKFLIQLKIKTFDCLDFWLRFKHLKRLEFQKNLELTKFKSLIVNSNCLEQLTIQIGPNLKFKIEFNEENIKCYKNDEITLTESKTIFKKYSIHQIDYFCNLFESNYQ